MVLRVTGFDLKNKKDKDNQQELSYKGFNPIPRDLAPIFEDFLNSRGITDYEIDGLRNDPDYPLSALEELFNRENLNFAEFVIYVHEFFPKLEKKVRKYLVDNGLPAGEIKDPEPTMREIFNKEYDSNLASFLLFYIKILYSEISTDADAVIDAPFSEHSAQLLALVQSLKEKINNVDQLRSLDLIETALEKYTNKAQVTTSNVLTEEERTAIMPSIAETNKITNEITDSVAYSIWDLIDKASENRIPKYQFRIGKVPLPQRSQQKMDYLMDVLNAIDKDTGKIDYTKWLPGFFDVGGGVANQILSEATQVKMLENIFEESIKSGLEKYTTLDAADKSLSQFLATPLAKELANKRYGMTHGFFTTLGEMAASAFTLFEQDREQGKYDEILPHNKFDKAQEEGYIDEKGNYHSPMEMDDKTKDFLKQTLEPATYEGIKESIPKMEEVPASISDAVGVNPFGNFTYDSPGSVFFPDTKEGLKNEVLNFSPSIESKIEDKLKDDFSSDSIRNIQEKIFENPELFEKSRFDGSFSKIPEVKDVLDKAGISEFSESKIKDAINSSYAENKFDIAGDNFLQKLGVAGNELLGNVSERLDSGYDAEQSPFANLVALAESPFEKISDQLGKLNVPFAPTSEQNAEELFGPAALAAKGQDLLTNYPPEVLAELMNNQADFKEPVPENNISKEQLEAYKKYKEAMESGSYGSGKPPESNMRKMAKAGRKAGEGARNAADSPLVSGAIAGAVIGAGIGAAPAALALSAFGAPANFVIGTALGTNKGRTSEFINFMKEATNMEGVRRKLVYSSGNVSYQLSTNRTDRLWNSTLGRVFGKIYEPGSLDFTAEEQADFSQSAPYLSSNEIINYGPLWQSFFIKSIKAKSYSERMNHLFAAETAKNFHMWYDRIVNFKFTNKSYMESLGIADGKLVEGVDYVRDIFSTPSFNKNASHGDEEVYDLEKVHISSKFKSSNEGLLANTLRFRSAMASFYSSFLGLTEPIRTDKGMFQGVIFYLNTLPQAAIKFGSGLQTLYSMLPKKVQNYFANMTYLGASQFIKPKFRELRVFDAAGKFLKEDYLVINRKTGKYILKTKFVTRKVIDGYQTSFGRFWTFLFGKETKVRSGLSSILLGETKTYYKNFVTRWYFRGVGFLQHGYSLMSNPIQYLQRQIIGYLKGVVFRLLKEFIKFLTEKTVQLISKVLINTLKITTKSLASSVLFTLGVGCVIVFVLLVLAMVATAAFVNANKVAYGSTFAQGDSSVAVVANTSSANGCAGSQNKTITFNGNQYTAKILNVPYVNQIVADIGDEATLKADTDKQSRVQKNPAVGNEYEVKGGGNMCGAATAVMIAGYFKGEQLISSSSKILQDYMYMNKNQNIDPNSSCTSIGGGNSMGSVQAGVNGAFYMTSLGGCSESSQLGIKRYLSLYGITTYNQDADVADRVKLQEKIKNYIDTESAPIVLSLSNPVNHVTLIIGYIQDSTGKVKGVVINDPYANLQNGGTELLYAKAPPNGGKEAIYDLTNSRFAINYILATKGTACNSVKLQDGDVVIQSMWQHKENYPLSKEFASLASSVKALNIDLGVKNSSKGNEVKDIEEKIISDANSLGKINITPPTYSIVNSSTNSARVTTWGNPDSAFVGKFEIGLKTDGTFFESTLNKLGYGMNASALYDMAKTYEGNFGVKAQLLSKGNKNNLNDIYSALDKGFPVIVWVNSNYDNISDSQITDLQNTKDSYTWKDSSGNTVYYQPNEHAVVIYGYNKKQGTLYVMDPYKGTSGQDTTISSSRSSITETKFMNIWQLFDYQGVIIGK